PYPEDYWPNEHHDYQRWLAEKAFDWSGHYGPREGIVCRGVPAEYHQTTWCANEAIAFMSERRNGPWLMSVNPFDPHPPFDPPPDYMERMDVDAMPLPLLGPEEMQTQLAFREVDHQTPEPRDVRDYDARRMVAAYYAQIELIDDQVGRMLEALEATGQRGSTIVIFMSDHGEMLGDHGLLRKGCRFYEGAVHVPLIVSWPGRFQADLRSDALVELTDVPVMLMEATGLDVPDYVQGRSIMGILTGRADPDRHRDFVRCEYHDAMPVRNASRANMIFDGRHKLVVHHGQEVGELYDLTEDPHEFRNLWDEASCLPLKHDLMKRIFDAVMQATDDGQPRVGAF
ncbi:MAG: sulfatase/phosphatase domain-containing protein, partial [Phycisphaerae bacterium]